MRAAIFAIALASYAAVVAPDAGAQAVASFTSARVDCGTGPSVSGGSPVSCSSASTHAAAQATYSTLKVEAAYAPLAFAVLQDSALFLPTDSTLIGTVGTARITLDFDGSVGIGPDNYLFLAGYEVDPATGLQAIRSEIDLVARTPSGIVFPFSGSGAPAVAKLTSSPEVATINGFMTFIFDYTFGSSLNYQFQMAAVAPSGTVDFYNTATISQVQAFDAAGNAADGSFTTTSGTILPTTRGAVPEPATWLTMILGFAAIGLAMRHKQRQTVRYSFGWGDGLSVGATVTEARQIATCPLLPQELGAHAPELLLTFSANSAIIGGRSTTACTRSSNTVSLDATRCPIASTAKVSVSPSH